MKKLILLILLMLSNVLSAQTTIWEENFDAQVGKGVSGDGNGGIITNLNDVNWTLDYSRCSFSATDDFVKVDAFFSGGRFEARDCNGEAVWESENINISKYKDVKIIVKIGETGSSNRASAKYIKLYSIVDANEMPFSVNGEGLGNFGVATASTTAGTGNSLKIRIKLRSDYAQDVYFDDIKVTGTLAPPTTNDTDSEISAADRPIANQTFTVATASESLKEVFRFKLTDKGSTDGNPTNLTKVVLKKASANTLDWEKEISKAVLQAGTASFTATITPNALTFNIPKGSMAISDGLSQEFSLKIKTRAKLTDGTKFQTQIETIHDFIAADTGSSFASPLTTPINSGITTFDVKATKLVVISHPNAEIAGTAFSTPITAQLQDNYGNIDADSMLTATITLVNGNGTLSPTSSFTQSPQNGKYSWLNLSYNRIGTAMFQIRAENFLSQKFNVLFTAPQSSLILENHTSIQNATILSSRNTAKQAKDFFKFTVKDKGDDGLPTIIESIQFSKETAFSESRLYYLIGGIILKENGKTIGTLSELNRKNGYSGITIPLSSPLEIQDGESKEITASIFLSTHKKLADGAKIQLVIEKKHNWTVDKSRTGIVSPLPNPVISPIFTVEVVATKLVFQKAQKNIIKHTPFSVTIAAINEQGLIDKDYNGTVRLSREAGTGTLSSGNGLSLRFTNGKATWTDLTYDKGETFTLLATSEAFPPIESSYINANDTDSEIQESTTPITNGIIASTFADETTAQPIFTFAIQDKATHDNSPTILTKAIFRNTHPSNEADWKLNIARAMLLQNGKTVATTDNISAEEITFRNSKGIATIPNGTTEILTLALFLKHNNIEDNKVLQCKILDNDLKTSSTGSSLQHSNKSISSPFTTIKVTATQVDFLKVPYALDTATATFTVKIAARDSNGNIDKDYTGSINLKDTQNIASANFNNGIASFSNLMQNGTTDFTLTAESSGLQSAKQVVIISPISTDLKADFEENTLQNWSSSANWKTSVIAPISGRYSLKHNLTNAVGTSKISQSIGDLKLQDATTVWRWKMKNGDWNPSSSNNFYYVLASENEDLATGTRYVVGVNTSGTNDLLTLSKLEDDKVTVLLSSEMAWKENGIAGIEVKLDSKGRWALAYDNNGGFDNLYTTGMITDNPNLSGELFTGFVFKHETASRAEQFWADDVLIYHFNTAPEVIKLKVLSSTQLEILFNQEMDKSTTESSDNYIFNKTISIKKVESTAPDKIMLKISELLTGTYNLTLKNLRSKAGILLPDTTLSFQYFAAAEKGEVVLNELMIDKTPAVKLPEYEYIELFNTTDKPFILTNWTISIGKYKKPIPADTIQPQKYVLLCKYSAQKALSAYGKAIAVTAFPALTNTSASVVLKNAEGLEIDNVSYQKAWYNTKEKENGGWSLERINPKTPSNSRANWAASQDSRGGTPGEKNSVFGIVLDNTPPAISKVIPISSNQVKINFNEAIDSLAIKSTQLFFVNGLGYPNEVAVSKDATQIILTFKDNFEYGKTYQIDIKEVIDLFGNALENDSATFGLPELALPNEIVINEILFNPVSGNVDYVELYNRSAKTFDLATLFIATRDSKNALKSVYLMSLESRLLTPKEFVVLTKSPELIAEQYDVKNPLALLEIKYLPSFPDTKGIVVILNQESTVIDELHYSEKMHLNLLSSKEGVALERVNYELPTQDKNNWQSAAATVGFGTPTYKNSAYSELQPFDSEIQIVPKVFSPNGDGIDDNMQIHYQFDSPGQIANVSIFDSKGRFVRIIARNLTLATKGIITWKGVNANNERARTGRYIIFIEIFDTKGNVKTYKKSCVLHGLFK